MLILDIDGDKTSRIVLNRQSTRNEMKDSISAPSEKALEIDNTIDSEFKVSPWDQFREALC